MRSLFLGMSLWPLVSCASGPPPAVLFKYPVGAQAVLAAIEQPQK